LGERGRLELEDRLIRWYKSKVDWWLVPLLAVPPVVASVVATASAMSGDPIQMAWGFGSLLFVTGIYVGLVFPMRYGIGGDRLIVRFGVCRQHVPFKDILEVRPTRNPLSSPALSLDRLHIQFGKGIFKAVMISPAEREQFLSHLAQSAGLHRDGDQLARPSDDDRDDGK
jgi:hypothetical protein